MYLYEALQCVADAPSDGRLVQSITMNIDTERVITEVRLRPVLWDLSNTLYKDRDARNASWLEVCQALNSNYDQLSTSEQKEYDKAVQQRWKTARDAYTKCKSSLKFVKSGSGSSSVKKKYVFYDHMTFLEKPHTATATEDSMLPPQSPTHNSPSPSPLPTPETPPSNDIEGENDNAQKENIKMKKKRKLNDDREFEKEMLKILKETSNNAKDDNLTFFISLLPILRNFSDYQKLLFRSEVLRVAMEVQRMSPAVSKTGSSMSVSSNRSQTPFQIIEEHQTQDLAIQRSQVQQQNNAANIGAIYYQQPTTSRQDNNAVNVSALHYQQPSTSAMDNNAVNVSALHYQQPSTSAMGNNAVNVSALHYQQPSTSAMDNNATNNIIFEGNGSDLKNFLIFK